MVAGQRLNQTPVKDFNLLAIFRATHLFQN